MGNEEKEDRNPSQPPLNLRGGARVKRVSDTPPLTPPQRGGENGETWSALSLAWELGYTIAVPLVVLALGGRLLDRKLDTSPWLLLAGIFLSLIVSSWLVYVKMVKIISKR